MLLPARPVLAGRSAWIWASSESVPFADPGAGVVALPPRLLDGPVPPGAGEAGLEVEGLMVHASSSNPGMSYSSFSFLSSTGDSWMDGAGG